MRKELTTYLREKYPLLYKSNGRGVGFECGDGWFNILLSLSENIQSHVDNQIKAFYNSKKVEKIIENKDVENYPYWYRNASPDFDFYASAHYVPELPSQPSVDQVKEKFGTLRYYITGGDEVIYGMIYIAESMSSHTCEECGAYGKLRSKGWIRVLCDIHALEDKRDITPYQQKVTDKIYVLFNQESHHAEIIEILEDDQYKVRITLENNQQTGYDKDVEADIIMTQDIIVKKVITPQITYFIALEKN